MAHKQLPTTIAISTNTIIKLLLVAGGLAFAWFIRDILALLFVALLLAALIEPSANWLARHKVPRSLSVLIIYAVLAALVTLLAIIITPPLISQLTSLGAGLTASFGDARSIIDQLILLLQNYGSAGSLVDSVTSLQQGITEGLTRVVSTVAGIFGGIATLVLVLVLAFYMVVEEADAKRLFRHLAPKKHQAYLVGLVGRMQEKLGHWLRGQIVLMLIIGTLTYLVLLIAGVEYALILGIFAGIAEIVPYAGPIIAAIPAVLIAFSMSPLKALIVLILYVVIQQVENTMLTPMIMKKSVGLNPVVIVFSLLVGFKIGGVVGALLAIPVATILAVLVKDLIGATDYSKSQEG